MKDVLGWIRFGAICAVSVAAVLGTGIRWLAQPSPIEAQTESVQVITAIPDVSSQADAESAVTEENTVSAVPTVAGEVAGAVIEKCIPATDQTAVGECLHIKNNTDLALDLNSLLKSPLPYQLQKNDKPQVLIVHTHTTECFLPEDRNYYTTGDKTRTRDETMNVVRLGNIITDRLNAAGIATVHDTTVHDDPSYNGSYDRSKVTVLDNLKKYPSIKIVIDLHRDSIGAENSDKVKPICEINGKKTAQIMLVMGSQSGGVTVFPNYRENLKLAARIQQSAETMYPSFARPMLLMSRVYNENLTTGSVLLEIGTEVNAIDEVCNAAECAADVLIHTFESLQ